MADASQPELARTLGRLDEFKGKWAALRRLPPERLAYHRRSCFLRNVVATCNIDGIEVDSEQLLDLLSREGGVHDLRTAPERLAAGVSRVMRHIIDLSGSKTRLTPPLMRKLQLEMLQFSPEDELHRGEYRWTPLDSGQKDTFARSMNAILDSESQVQGASASAIPTLLDKLATHTTTVISRGPDHPVVASARFTAGFLAIQPFQVGNGRLSRALSQMLLLSAGYEHLLYHPLDEMLQQNSKTYYSLLAPLVESVDNGLSPLPSDRASAMDDWVTFYTQILLDHSCLLQRKIRREHRMAPLPELSEQILEVAREHGRATVAAIVRVTGANRNTVKVHFRRLRDQGHLEMHGAGRGAWYSPASGGSGSQRDTTELE